MDYDRNQFYQDVFESLVHAPGDPAKNFDKIVEKEIQLVVKFLKEDAREQRKNIITMAEQRKANPRELVKTLWASSSVESYDRRR